MRDFLHNDIKVKLYYKTSYLFEYIFIKIKLIDIKSDIFIKKLYNFLLDFFISLLYYI